MRVGPRKPSSALLRSSKVVRCFALDTVRTHRRQHPLVETITPAPSSTTPQRTVRASRHVELLPLGEDGWLFVGQGDQPPHQNTVGHRWRNTLNAAGLTGVRLHDLRHYYASGLIAAGCDVVTVQRALGHSKATTTLNTYSHLWPTAEDRTRKAADGMLAAALSPPKDSPRTLKG